MPLLVPLGEQIDFSFVDEQATLEKRRSDESMTASREGTDLRTNPPREILFRVQRI